MKNLMLVAMLLLFQGASALMTVLPNTGFADSNKVLICHRPPDNPSNYNVLSVGQASVADHLAHGDNVLGVETCDAVDNDCDGLVDEDSSGNPLTQSTTCGVGDCAGNTGYATCVNGVFTNDTCDPMLGASPEFCDGSDNDCDGIADEDNSGNPLTQGTTCGVGECAGNIGSEMCLGGSWTNDTCDPLNGASPEICDGLDNDCDFLVDEEDNLCGLAEICDAGNGCIPDPSLVCPCDSFLDDGNWDDGSIPFGGCISNAGDGFPRYGLVKELYGGPATISFILDAGDIEPDGIRDYACWVLESDDGIGGNPPVSSPVLPVVGELDLLGCAARMSGTPIPVLECITP